MSDIKEVIEELGYEDAIVYDTPSYDGAIIGVTADGIVVYNYGLMVEELVSKGFNREEAEEWIDYNVVNVYLGEKTPIIVYPLPC